MSDLMAEKMVGEGKAITIKLPGVGSLRQKAWMLVSVVLALVLVLMWSGFLPSGLGGSFVAVTGEQISSTEAGENAIKYINDYIVSTGEATLVDVEEIGEIYKVTTSYQGNEIDIHITKDGKWLFINEIPIDITVTPTTTTTQPEQIPKSDRSKVDFYVMSFCPYGNDAENTMFPVYNLLKDKVDWNIHYIVSVSGGSISSLHGQKEVDQNEREACVLKEYGLDKWWLFVTYVNENCGSDGSCWKDSAKEAGVVADKIETCVEEEGLDLMKKEAEASTSAGVTGSPTLMINGVMSRAVYQYGNSEAYKQAICSAFNSLPKECEQILSSSGSSAGGQC